MGERDGEVTRVLKRVAATLGSGKFDEALRDLLHLSEKYPDAGEIRPQIAEVLLRRGESRARRGRVKEARDDFERSLRWIHKPAALVALARSLMAGDSFVFAKGDSAEARPYWEKAIALNPKNFGALFNLAAETASRGDRDVSLGYLQRCAALDLDRTRKLWKEDMASPMKKFGDF